MPAQAPALTDERDLLLAFLAQQRDGIRYATHGLSDEQARTVPSVSALSLGGLVKHGTAVERSWIDMVLQRSRGGSLAEKMAAHEEGFQVRPVETLAGLLEAYAEMGRETEAAIRGIADLAQAVPVPRGVPWFPADLDAWSVRWVLLHLIEETARHAGHADITRESIDRATTYELMAAAEGWPATDWLQPWEPASAPA